MFVEGVRPLHMFYFHQPDSRGKWAAKGGWGLLAICSQTALVTPGGMFPSVTLLGAL